MNNHNNKLKMNRKQQSVVADNEEQPFIKDFAFYKTRFTTKHKEIKKALRDFGVIVERFASQQDKTYG